MLRRLQLYLNTVRWLQPGQILWFIYRRLRPVINPAPVAAENHRSSLATSSFIGTPAPEQNEFRFLNVSRPADPDKIDWHPADMSRLWRYNLHYFDYLNWRVMPDADKRRYIADWIIANPMGSEDAWEPYTVSLRIVNWIKFFATTDDDVPAEWHASLLNQANWLAHNLERHILANHFLKNTKALLFAGAWFTGPLGQRLLAQGLTLFATELKEQFLADGGHYERSPMYHSICLEDCLDVVNILQSLSVDSDVQSEIQDTALRGLRFLDEVVLTDGRIALFNDSAHGIAPEPGQLFAYGQRLLGFERSVNDAALHLINAGYSGYYGYRCGSDSMLIDAGPIGPDYQPGHAHCDALSFELCRNGRRIVVDSGVYGYDADQTRNVLRGTAAHNTVVVNGAEQSEIWGTFRVARRARPLDVSLEQTGASQLNFTASHDGYRRLAGNIIHTRRMTIDTAVGLTVADSLAGAGEAQAESFLHLHPDIVAQRIATGRIELQLDGVLLATLDVPEEFDTELGEADYCPEFGVRQRGAVVSIRAAGELPLSLEYRLRWA